MAQGTIITSTATGSEISAIINILETALDGVNRGHAIISCLSLVLALMDPEITSADLQTGVRDVSQFVCMWLDARGEGTPDGPKILLN
jgi:hypothetical protein